MSTSHLATTLRLLTGIAVIAGGAASALGAAKTIVVDGDPSDWDAGDLLYADAEISDGAPIESSYANVYVANDTNNLYLGLETKGTGGGDIFNLWTHSIYLDTDQDPGTGYNAGAWAGGYDRVILYGANAFEESVYEFTGATQATEEWGYLTFVANAFSDSFIEIAIPLSDLGLAIDDVARIQLVVSGTGVSVITEAHSTEASAKSYTLAEPAPPSGSYKSITIDGNFGDWTGIPLLHTSPTNSIDPTVVDYQDIYAANDDDYLYLRFTLHATKNPFTAPGGNIFLDTDNDDGSGYGAQVGSEMLIQGGSGYQQKNGGFNEGAVSGVDWSAAPVGEGTEFECRISRSATYDSDGQSVFANDVIAFVLEADDAGWNSTEWAPAVGGLVYKFESAPTALTTNLALVNLTSSWQANDSGADLGVTWLDQAYDDTVAGWSAGTGLLGYTPNPGSYPTINTSLASGPTTYYFRTHFDWAYANDNVAFVITNYLSDGAIVYLNGAEVRRIRMPEGPVDSLTAATGSASPVGQAEVFGVSGGPLFIGDNILEVETHQESGTGADMVLGLSFTAAAQYPVVNVNPDLPVDQSVVAGDSVTFTTDVIGSGPMSYQWMKDGAPLAGADEASLTIPVVLTTDAGNYALVASNALSSITTRAAALSLSATPVTIDDDTQPGDAYPSEGQPLTLEVFVSGSPVLEYQWFKNNNPIPGATNQNYTIASVAMTDAGGYMATITNPAGSTNSRTAVVTVVADMVAPSIIDVAAAASQIVVSFSSPVDPATANDAANYLLSDGLTVSSATVNPGEATQVTLTTGSGMVLGTVYQLTVDGVTDLFGNPAKTTVSFTRTITIDGDFGDWEGVAPLYSGPMGVDGGADVKDVWMYNDANYYYFRITLWHDIPSESGQFPDYANILHDTDDNASTGFSPGSAGSEMLVQSGSGYQQKNGGFNEGGINNLDWMCMPAEPGTNFEFRVSRAATYDTDGLPVFTTDVLHIVFQGQNTSWSVVNTAPASGQISFTNLTAVVVPPLPLGSLAIDVVPDGQVSVSWESAGALQATDTLNGGTWTNLPATPSPYVFPADEAQSLFRLGD